jgi:hypothetical protein
VIIDYAVYFRSGALLTPLVNNTGKLSIAGALLDKGLSVNVQDSNMATPLITASFKSVVLLRSLFLTSDADPVFVPVEINLLW